VQKSAELDLAPTVNVRPRATPAIIESIIVRITNVPLSSRVARQPDIPLNHMNDIHRYLLETACAVGLRYIPILAL